MGVQPLRKSSEPRFRKRVPCRLTMAGDAHVGIVLNVSRGGLFVQTTARARSGDAIRLDLRPGSAGNAIEIGAQVVWKRVVAPQLRAVSQGGLGLRIRHAPGSYYRFLAEVAQVPGA